MLEERKYVLTIAGFDPSGGAGLLADVKTFESHKVYGLAVNTGNTIQTENKFHSVSWEKIEAVLETINVLTDEYEINIVKTGIAPSFEYLNEIVSFLRSKNEKIKIIVDPVMKSSTGFSFSGKSKGLESVLKQIYLITPNTDEAISLSGNKNAIEAAKALSKHTNVLLKGGHNSENVGLDILFSENKAIEFKPQNENIFPKHGSGCILSAAIAANLALGISLEEACRQAKNYTEKKLLSNSSLLAYHHV